MILRYRIHKLSPLIMRMPIHCMTVFQKFLIPLIETYLVSILNVQKKFRHNLESGNNYSCNSCQNSKSLKFSDFIL